MSEETRKYIEYLQSLDEIERTIETDEIRNTFCPMCGGTELPCNCSRDE